MRRQPLRRETLCAPVDGEEFAVVLEGVTELTYERIVATAARYPAQG